MILLRRCSPLFSRRGTQGSLPFGSTISGNAWPRSHMNHGGSGGGFLAEAPASLPGPRMPAVTLGLEAARHTNNILRLLEASHGGGAHGHGSSYYLAAGGTTGTSTDALATLWHPQSLCWRWGGHHDDDDGTLEWQAWSPMDAVVAASRSRTFAAKRRSVPPQLLSFAFADDRTAVVKLRGLDGGVRFLSLLRLDKVAPTQQQHYHHGPLPNDGWILLREVLLPPPDDAKKSSSSSPITTEQDKDLYDSLMVALRRYLSIEHGGGADDRHIASELFHAQSSLLTVGMSPPTEAPSDWSAPVGSFLEISRTTYLDGVGSQTPHASVARQHDQIVGIDVVSSHDGGTAAMALATVRVGNGSQTFVFEDHLLCGYSPGGWQILSKVFSPQAWPDES